MLIAGRPRPPRAGVRRSPTTTRWSPSSASDVIGVVPAQSRRTGRLDDVVAARIVLERLPQLLVLVELDTGSVAETAPLERQQGAAQGAALVVDLDGRQVRGLVPLVLQPLDGVRRPSSDLGQQPGPLGREGQGRAPSASSWWASAMAIRSSNPSSSTSLAVAGSSSSVICRVAALNTSVELVVPAAQEGADRLGRLRRRRLGCRGLARAAPGQRQAGPRTPRRAPFPAPPAAVVCRRPHPGSVARAGSLGGMTGPLSPTIGWNVLHLFSTVTPLADAAAVAAAVKDLEAEDHQVVPVALVGHKGDVCLLALGPDLWRLRRFQTGHRGRARRGRQLRVAHGGVRVRRGHARGAQERPALPPAAAGGEDRRSASTPCPSGGATSTTGTSCPTTSREQLMLGHGGTGRTFAGRVLQLVTGSTGLDDYEWGVTLFGVHPDDLKACVYTMRYDKASSRYAEFGRFVTGVVGTLDEVLGRRRGLIARLSTCPDAHLHLRVRNLRNGSVHDEQGGGAGGAAHGPVLPEAWRAFAGAVEPTTTTTVPRSDHEAGRASP